MGEMHSIFTISDSEIYDASSYAGKWGSTAGPFPAELNSGAIEASGADSGDEHFLWGEVRERPVSRFAMEENIDSTMIFDEGGQMVTNPTFLQDHGAGSESDGESNNSSSSTSTQSEIDGLLFGSHNDGVEDMFYTPPPQHRDVTDDDTDLDENARPEDESSTEEQDSTENELSD
eukprot:m.167264 g.167264  ORF g.167264 m.167264 type:complete len:175 (+) comp15302_c0_seq6:6916-7440(+)